MKKIGKKRIAEIGVVVLLVLIGVASYIGSAESVVGKTHEEIIKMAGERNDYELAQMLYKSYMTGRHSHEYTRESPLKTESVLGAATNTNDIEMLIYPEMKIAAEIARVESLLDNYPTYPPLLQQLAELYRMNGDEEKADEYEREMERLRVQ